MKKNFENNFRLCLLIYFCLNQFQSTDTQAVQFLKTIGGTALDLFGLGADVFDIVNGATDDIDDKSQELSDKLDMVLNSVDGLYSKIIDLFEQEDLKDKLEYIESFRQDITSRLQDLKLIAQTIGTEQFVYIQKFKDTTTASLFVDHLHHFVQNMYTPSSGKTIFHRVAESQRCNMSYVLTFIGYIRATVYSGITIETAFDILKYKYNFTASHEKQYWDEQLGFFENVATKTVTDCQNKFPQYYLEDIQSSQSTKPIGDMCGILHARYRKGFLVVEKKTTTDIYITDTGDRLQFTCIQQSCGKMRCFAYAELNATCENIPAVHLSTKSKQELKDFCTTDNWPGYIKTYRTGGRLDWYLLPYGCSHEVSKSTSLEFIPPADDQVRKADGVTCITSGSWGIDLDISLCVIALFYAL